MSCDCWYSVVLLPNAVGCMQLVIVLFPDHLHLLIGTVYPATALCNGIMQHLVSMPDNCSWQVVLCSWQLQAVGATYYIVTVFLEESVTCALEWKYIKTTSPPEPLVQIQNNFTELFLMMPSTKIAQMVLLQQIMELSEL